ncbi:adenylate/guanylate cyclase domain-containing protein [Bacteroidota bacterium]
MPEDRRLAAIMFTDIVGYTALMGSNEDKAFQLLRKNRDLQRPLIKKYRGDWLKEMGDGILASFHTASDAVRCAGEIQNEAKKTGIGLRIGIHEGEVVFEGSDVLGDGVNVASRLQEAADEGSINISEAVYKDIKNKAGIKAEFVKKKTLKNIDEPIRIYTVTCEEPLPSSSNQVISDSILAEKNSIIVLPFVNISPDPDQEYFSEGLTEEIITDLSHIHDLLVISRSSAMTFKGTKKKISEIADEVNVRYVLEGSVRKAGNNLRITAQLIDALTDTHIWAEKYSGTLDDVFDIQEEVSRMIAEELKVKLSAEENTNLAKRPIENIKVYEYYLKASEEITRFSQDAINRALRYLQNAIDISGNNALLYSGMSFAYWNLVNIGAEQEDYLDKAKTYAEKALSIDPDSPLAHAMLGYVDMLGGKTLESLSHFKRALESNPDEIFGLVGILSVYFAAGRLPEAYPYIEKLMRIDPLSFPANWCNGGYYYYNGQFERALQAFKRLFELHPDNPFSQFMYALMLVYNKMISEAILLIDQNAKSNPETVFSRLGLILKYAIQNEKEKLCQEMSPELIKSVSRDFDFSLNLGRFFSLINDKKEAIHWIENSIKNGFINYPILAEKDPFLENIRSEPGYRTLMESVKHEWENFEV